jgi:hypothetical protein
LRLLVARLVAVEYESMATEHRTGPIPRDNRLRRGWRGNDCGYRTN